MLIRAQQIEPTTEFALKGLAVEQPLNPVNAIDQFKRFATPGAHPVCINERERERERRRRRRRKKELVCVSSGVKASSLSAS